MGADIHVGELDRGALESLKAVRAKMHEFFPNMSFASEIRVDNVTDHTIEGDEAGLMFTGGADSSTSYFRNVELAPRLITVRGLQLLHSRKSWPAYRAKLAGFGERMGVPNSFVGTNTREIFDEKEINFQFRHAMVDSWWPFRHSVTTLGMAAPITFLHGIDKLLFASTFTSAFDQAWGSHPDIDEAVSWAGLKVIHDSFDLGRQEKFEFLVPHFERDADDAGNYNYLQICNGNRDSPDSELVRGGHGCGRCDKCLSAIMGIALAGMDPVRCGFPTNDGTFTDLRRWLENTQRPLSGSRGSIAVLKGIQDRIPDEIGHDFHGSKPFFEWFRSFDFSEFDARSQAEPTMLRRVYRMLPKGVREMYRVAKGSLQGKTP